MRAAGLADAAAGFGLRAADIAAVVRAAPAMRPERHTVLERAGPHGRRPCAGAVDDVLG